jgi:hypothetical protein
MGLITDLLPVINGVLTIGFPMLIVFDRHDDEEVKYIKTYYFLSGCVIVFEAYRFSKIGREIDGLLNSTIFY